MYINHSDVVLPYTRNKATGPRFKDILCLSVLQHKLFILVDVEHAALHKDDYINLPKGAPLALL